MTAFLNSAGSSIPTAETLDAVIGHLLNPGMAKFEEFELSAAAQVGMAVAAKQALELGTETIEGQVVQRADRLRAELREIDGVTVHDNAERVCGIVTFSVHGSTPAEMVKAAADHGATINSTGASWATPDLQAKGLTQVVRVSPHTFNTDDEVHRVVEAVHSLRR